MGSIYKRGDSGLWWVSYAGANGKRRLQSSGTPDEAKARKLLAACEREVAAQRKAGVSLEVLTVAKYAKDWIHDRELRDIASWKDDKRRLEHALPMLGAMPLAEVKRADVRAAISKITAAGELAPRTVRHVYGVLRVMFSDALADGYVSATPCTLKQRRKEIPPKQDADLAWRETAVYSADEVAQLVSDARIPKDRRTIYALLFLGGMRIGEVAARTWADLDETAQPLARLACRTSFNRKQKRIKGVKTDRPRDIPVHPTLGAILKDWRASGWREFRGRDPEPEDLIVTSRTGLNLRDPVVLERLHADLALLDLRPRRTHDARRTFVSLCLAGGANRDLLRWISHGPEGDQLGGYTSLPWGALCEQVLCLKMPATVPLRPQPGNEKAPKSKDLEADFECPRRDSNPDSLIDTVRTWATLSTKEARLASPLLPAVKQFFASTVATVADPSGCERQALLDGFTVSPPWDLLAVPPGSIH